mmetsp:Transcript_12378/g.19034  ORF Transcript_12378/g.19034 Transcript_12378/m.19034 type:complete len:1032 (-) Transcript_12378:353-3448(-)
MSQEEKPLEMSEVEFGGVPESESKENGIIENGAIESPKKNMTAREIAMREAQTVLDASESMDGFNLLGVVANPRGPHDPKRKPSSTIPSIQMAPTVTGENGSGLEDTLHALESTLSQVTEQIDAFNYVVDSWSRHYLGTLYDDDTSLLEYVPFTEMPEMQLTELPKELSTLTLGSVQTYLNETGVLANAFEERDRFHTDHPEWHESVAPDSSIGDIVDINEAEFMESLEEIIPSLFFETYFNLTDAATFEELLVVKADENEEIGDKEEAITDGSTMMKNLPECLSVPTKNILDLPPPESFTGFLDKVEIALLQQVRSKSVAFFHETNRFGQLKEWISSLVEEVQRVRKLLSSVQDRSVVAWELIPLLDKQRQDLSLLSELLDGANEVIRCKASISGLLSANDDFTAAEQIQYGRKLLQHEDVKKLVALRTVNDQFSQYENLVVANLGEELVEVLLDWKSFAKTTSFPRIQNMVHGLQMCNSLERVSKLYSARLLDVIRMTIRTTVSEFSEEADSSFKVCVTSMTLERFEDCLDMLFEQLLDIKKSAVGVQNFGKKEGVDLSMNSLASSGELSTKSISELLRIRKEAHSLITLNEMKALWDRCIKFTTEVEALSDYKATVLRSTLLAQAKAFVERQHESNMSSLVAALDSERWIQCDVSAERQQALTRLCTGRAVVTIRQRATSTDESSKSKEAEVEGTRYKVVWSCLLLVEMLMNNIACAAHFQALAINVVGKVAELLRLFNSRSTQLVLGAGAIHSAARLKSINAKHLSLVTQCLGMTIAILPHVRAALMAQLQPKQHGLLQDLDKIKREYSDHNERVLNKFVTIIGGIVEHNLAPRISGTNFDARATQNKEGCCAFLEGVTTNMRKMHQVLANLLPPDHLQDVFSRIFAHVDTKIPDIFLAASVPNQNKPPSFYLPTTDAGKRQMLQELETMTINMNKLPGVRPWEFTAVKTMERKLEIELRSTSVTNGSSNSHVPGDLHDETSESDICTKEKETAKTNGQGIIEQDHASTDPEQISEESNEEVTNKTN